MLGQARGFEEAALVIFPFKLQAEIQIKSKQEQHCHIFATRVRL